MRPENKNDLVYLLRILEAIGKINLYSNGYHNPFELFEANNQKDFNACLLQMLHIGEQINRISQTTKDAHSDVPWQSIKSFRNIVAHDYIGIDKLIVFDTIRHHLPVLKKQLCRIIGIELQSEVFDRTEYELSKASQYYKHIDFENIA